MKFIKFTLVGMGSAGVQFLTLFYFVDVVPVGDEYAVGIAYLFSVCFHFFMNRIFTFAVSGSLVPQELIRYFLLVLLNFCITLLLVYVGITILKVNPYVVTLTSIILTFCFSYVVTSKYIFVVGSTLD